MFSRFDDRTFHFDVLGIYEHTPQHWNNFSVQLSDVFRLSAAADVAVRCYGGYDVLLLLEMMWLLMMLLTLLLLLSMLLMSTLSLLLLLSFLMLMAVVVVFCCGVVGSGVGADLCYGILIGVWNRMLIRHTVLNTDLIYGTEC